MKLLIITNMREEVKEGLFIATHNRIKHITEKSEIYSLVKYDNWLISFLKKIFGKKILKKYEVDFFEHDGIKYNYIYYADSICNRIKTFLGLDTYLKKVTCELADKKSSNYDFILSHWGHPHGSLAFRVGEKLNIPYSITLHGSDIHTHPQKSNGIKKIVTRNITHAKCVFFVSNNLREIAKKIGVSDNKSFISYNAIDNNVFYPFCIEEIKKKRSELGLNKKVIGFVGNLNNNKRADKLIKIFEEINKLSDHTYTFFIIGDGILKNQIKNDIRNSALDVRYIGNQQQTDLNNYYNMIDCLIVPSKREGLGNVVLEAQACLTPVVATNTGGIPEIINNKQNLVPNVEDTIVEEFARAVLNVVNNEYDKNHDNLSWKEVVDKEMKIIRKMLEVEIFETK